MASKAVPSNAAVARHHAYVSALDEAVAALDPEYLRRQRWFGSKSKSITGVRLHDQAFLQMEPSIWVLALVEIAYAGFDPELYFIPVMITDHPLPGRDQMLQLKSPTGFVYEALADDEFCRQLVRGMAQKATVPAARGTFVFDRTAAYLEPETWTVKRIRAEQSNTSIIIGETMILKSFRKLELGTNPDAEISRFLTTKTDFTNIPFLAGMIEYDSMGALTATALLQRYVPNQGNAWDYTLRHLDEFYALASSNSRGGPESSDHEATRAMRAYAQDAGRLGRITGQLHRALASDLHDPDFAPEPIAPEDIARWSRSIAQHIESGIRALERHVSSLDPAIQTAVRTLINDQAVYVEKVEELRGLEDQAYKIRCHGDYHLGQVLKTDDDFYILDFEGEPLRSLAERREKASPLKDVAGMLRSFHYAGYAGLFTFAERHPPESHGLDVWTRAWVRTACQAFFSAYLKDVRSSSVTLVPSSDPVLRRVLSVFLLDKAIYELNYELNHRPSWLKISLEGIQAALELI